MREVRAIIERASDGTYSVYMDADDMSYLITGTGKNAEEAINSFKTNYDDMKRYYVEKGKKFEEVPTLYRIKNDRRCEYAKELVDIAMRRIHVPKVNDSNKDFSIPYEDTKTLISKGFIKEFKKKLK